MKEKWKYWKPAEFITQDYEVTRFVYGSNGTYAIIESNDEDKASIKINFGYRVELCRITNERSLNYTVCNVQNMNGDNFFVGKSFFIVENSKLIEWLEKESAGLMECFELKHFVFLNDNDFIDIISHCDPDIKVIKK